MKLFDAFRGHWEQRPDEPAFMIASGDRALPISWRQFTDDIAVFGLVLKSFEHDIEAYKAWREEHRDDGMRRIN